MKTLAPTPRTYPAAHPFPRKPSGASRCAPPPRFAAHSNDWAHATTSFTSGLEWTMLSVYVFSGQLRLPDITWVFTGRPVRRS